MKVCLDLRAVTPGATGIGAFARSAVGALVGHGGAHHFLAVVHRQAPDGIRPAANCQVLVASESWAWGEIELPVLLEEHGVDVLFSPLFSCPVVRSARQVVTLHDVFPESHPELCTPEFTAFWRSRLGPSLRSACHAVAVSDWSKAQAVKHLELDPARVSVARQSVGSHFRPVPSEEAEPVLARHGLRFRGYSLYIGALDPRKNLDRLVRAFARIDGKDLILAMAGRPTSEGYDLGAVITKAEMVDRVKFLGYVPDAELPALYSGARCFAFPSLAEGFGRPCIEAMQCGVPVVASNRTALPETCGEAALLPDAEEEQSMTEALDKACFDDVVRQRLVEGGARRAADFSPERFASDLITAFKAALAGPKEGLWPA